MPRYCLLFASLLLISTSALAQDGDVIPVKATGKDTSFYDQFVFLPASGSTALPRGVLQTGGFTAYGVISRQVPETRVRAVTYPVYRIVNGRLVVEYRTREEQYTVYKPVYETITIELPAANGTWYGVTGPQNSTWTITALTSAGAKVGYGIRVGGNVYGFVTIVSLPGSEIPTGTYLVATTADVIGPGEEEMMETPCCPE